MLSIDKEVRIKTSYASFRMHVLIYYLIDSYSVFRMEQKIAILFYCSWFIIGVNVIFVICLRHNIYTKFLSVLFIYWNNFIIGLSWNIIFRVGNTIDRILCTNISFTTESVTIRCFWKICFRNSVSFGQHSSRHCSMSP